MLKNIILCLTFLILVSCGDDKSELTDGLMSSGIIIGQESRKESVNLPSIYKNRTGQLISSVDSGNVRHTTTCTATAIAPNLILTAAHCAYNSNTNKLLSDMYFVPGMTKENHMPYGRFRVIKTYHPALYDPALPLDIRTDMAIMVVSNNIDNKNLSQTVGTHLIRGERDFAGSSALTVGYPGDKPIFHQYFENNCPVEKLAERIVNIECDVFKGQSGSPLFISSDKKGKYFIDGVISGEGREMNFASLITKERAKIISSIKNNKFVTNDYKENWKAFDHTRQSTVNVLFKNTCKGHTNISVTVFYYSKNNKWDFYFPVVIAPGETIELIQTTNSSFEFYVENDKGTVLESGKYLRQTMDGDIFPLKRVKYPRSGDYEFSYGCN